MARLHDLFTVMDRDGAADAEVDEALPEAFAVVGQQALPTERLDRAHELRAMCNVEGNLYQNVDYATCFARRDPRAELQPRLRPGGRGIRAGAGAGPGAR